MIGYSDRQLWFFISTIIRILCTNPVRVLEARNGSRVENSENIPFLSRPQIPSRTQIKEYIFYPLGFLHNLILGFDRCNFFLLFHFLIFVLSVVNVTQLLSVGRT